MLAFLLRLSVAPLRKRRKVNSRPLELQPRRPTGDLEWFHDTFRFFLSYLYIGLQVRCKCWRIPLDDEYDPYATNKGVETLSNQHFAE